MKKTFVVASLSSLLLAIAAGCASPQVRTDTETTEPDPQVEQIEQYAKFELELADGDDDVSARFVEPDGDEVSVGGFDDGDRRMVRFTPVELGGYTYTVVDEAGATLADGEFESVDADRAGFVRIDPEGGYPGLEHDDGSPFILLGENRINIYDPSWNWQQKDIDEYVAYMADNGMTTLRVFVFSDCENEESDDGIQPGCLEPEVGEFDPEVAQRFDEIFEAAEDEGIYVVLVPYAIGFSPDDTWKSWEDNPYSAERGGPAEDRFAFFDDAEVRDAAFERFRYVINRWGYSPNLVAIDLLNEPEWDGEISEETWTPWARQMADRIEQIDPYDHLITVGPVGLHWNIEGDEHAWWGDERNDLVQWHRYGPDTYDVHDLAAELSFRTEESRRHDKPIFAGEFGYGGDPSPNYDHTQVGIWSLTMSGAGALAHSAPPFNIDSDEYMTPERAAHFTALRGFLEPLLEHAPLFPDPVRELDEPGARMWTLRGDDALALWVMAAKEGYSDTVEDMQVDVHLPKGSWEIEWIDDTSGEVVSTKTTTSAGQRVVLSVPDFERHIATRIIRAAG